MTAYPMAFQILTYLQIVSKDSSLPPQGGEHDREISPLVDGITGLRTLKGLAQHHTASNGDLGHPPFFSAFPCVFNVSICLSYFPGSHRLSVCVSVSTPTPVSPFSSIYYQSVCSPFLSPCCRSQQRRKSSHLTSPV